ncbi:MAG: CTP synthase, partial [Eubacteriales bacterium]|nr:CTP synthase [Eubacteriales bacterium]
MSVKYVFVTGGVVSGLGKGITAASLGRLLKARGFRVTMQKFDPYLNVDPGTMNPIQHGEVFVTDDGAETDLDLGHYERFIDESLNKGSCVTSGKIYSAVLNKERKGDYGGGTVQIIPHVTNEIKSRIYKGDVNYKGVEIAIIEVGGTVGDIESQPHIEAIRQFKLEKGHENVILIHVTLIPYIGCSQELKTKPTQTSVKALQGLGIQPDIIVARSEIPLDNSLKSKISLFCNVQKENVIQNLDVDILYEVPIKMEKEGLAKAVLNCLKLKDNEPDLSDWKKMISNFKNPKGEVNIALVGKYTVLHDAYLSVVEALKAAGAYNHHKVNIIWVDSEKLTKTNLKSSLKNIHGIIVPGGFGKRGTSGIELSIKYARENKIPYLGICLGMQLACLEFARNVCGIKEADSTEFEINTKDQIIHIMPDQMGVEDLGGTLRLGSYPCILDKNSKSYKLFAKEKLEERHRHRFEFNNDYREIMTKNGMLLAGKSPDDKIIEIIELIDHPFFIATQ